MRGVSPTHPLPSMSLGVKRMRVTAGLGWSEYLASVVSCAVTQQ